AARIRQQMSQARNRNGRRVVPDVRLRLEASILCWQEVEGSQMEAIHEEAAQFLSSVLEQSGLALAVRAFETEEGCRFNLDGPDSDLLFAQSGELLDALQHLVNQVFLKDLSRGDRLICDANDFRATRESELRAMANHAAQRVRSSNVPFSF